MNLARISTSKPPHHIKEVVAKRTLDFEAFSSALAKHIEYSKLQVILGAFDDDASDIEAGDVVRAIGGLDPSAELTLNSDAPSLLKPSFGSRI